MIRKTRCSKVADHAECAHDHQEKVKGSLVKIISMKARWKEAKHAKQKRAQTLVEPRAYSRGEDMWEWNYRVVRKKSSYIDITTGRERAVGDGQSALISDDPHPLDYDGRTDLTLSRLSP